MKKLFLALTLVSLVSSAFAKNVKVNTLNGKNEASVVEVPYNPKRVAILDLAALDIIDNLGLGNRVVGSATTSIDYLSKYSPDKNKKIKNIGTIKTPDVEAVFECEPDVIFIGGRLASRYDELSEIAPVVYLSTDMTIGLKESVKKNTLSIASIFGKEKDALKKFSSFEERISSLNKKASNKNAILGMVTSGSCNLLGNSGRLNLITNEIGFTNIGANKDVTSSHGEETSFELIAKLNPEYIFVLDRDSAIGTKGAKLAKDIMDNELVNTTTAYKNSHVVILSSPAVWYTAEGGITALSIMLTDLERVL